MHTRDVIPIYLRVKPRDIALIKFVIESYEGVGILRTIERKVALIVLLVAPDFLDSARAILASLDCEWEEVAGSTESDDWLRDEA